MPNVKVKVIVEVDGQRVAKDSVKADVSNRDQARVLAAQARTLVDSQYAALTRKYGV